ncbi:DELLA protein GAI-like [Impatiens glandulifera]|uniref:DELLA protein GAI-like n=1 Tax=Impatiens glandulifera TaxID=253017 RepID=UPI001FB13CC1|nr:DELLA protein GAI-like [Impatiens glandulifera]
MGPYDSYSSSSSSGSSSSVAGKIPDQIDGHLERAGYKVRSSDLHQVAHRIERLETAMVSNLANNPSHLGSWVDSILSEPDPPIHFPHLGPAPDANPWAAAAAAHHPVVIDDVEEDSGIRLVHLLMSCAETIQRGEFSLAATIIDEMQGLLTRVNTSFGIGKVAGYFVDALSRRIFSPPQSAGVISGSNFDNEILYRNFYEASPYLKFAHFTANQAILEAFDGHDCVHVVDFNLMEGLQWPALIQALALRPGGSPILRLTGVGPPSPDGRDSLREIGLRLAELARSVNVRFAFRGVAALRLEDVKPWMLQVNPNEVLAVNSIMQLHTLLAADPTRPSRMDSVLEWIKNLNPKIVTVVEPEVDHNQPEFLERFMEALYYYSTIFDSLEVCSNQPDKALAEMYIQKQICNVVCCEGSGRIERHETLAKWRARFTRAGFRPVNIGFNAFKQASMLLTLFSAEGYNVEENDGCLTLGWHNRPLIAASAWYASPGSDPIYQ